MQASDLPEFSRFPVTHRILYNYHVGMFYFINEKYEKAEELFTSAFLLCRKSSHFNKRLILDYLIPLRLLKGQQPQKELLNRHQLFIYNELLRVIKSGNVAQFPISLCSLEKYLFKRRTFLIFERLLFLCYRNLIRSMYLVI